MTPAVQWSKVLRWRAAEWLRYQRRCMIVCFERPADYGASHAPDVLAIDRARRLIEVEIKVSMSDFRADKEKGRHRFKSSWGLPFHQFYYAVRPSMVAKVLLELPDFAGVLSLPGDVDEIPYYPHPKRGEMEVRHKSPVQKHKKASIAQCLRMAENQSGTLVSLAKELCRI